MNSKLLREYKCKICNNLLYKGHLDNSYSTLEVKCKKCGCTCVFYGKNSKDINNDDCIKNKIVSGID